MSPTILEFPKDKIVREAPNPLSEQLERLKEKGLQNFADGLINELSSCILQDLNSCGIDIESEIFNKDYCVALDMLAASVYRSLNISHPLHSFLDNNVKVADEEET